MLKIFKYDYHLIFKIIAILPYAKLLIFTKKIAYIEKWIAIHQNSNYHIDDYRYVKKVTRYTNKIAVFMPFKSLCYDKALTVKKIVNQNNISTELNMGVCKENNQLKAHAWISYHGYLLMGGANSKKYTAVRKII